VVCRSRSDQATLVRVRRSAAGEPVFGAGEGRSAYLCERAECLEHPKAKERVERALRHRFGPDASLRLAQELECHQR
jgi:predicted RNA-binding protein YlxR (DUF448 family)